MKEPNEMMKDPNAFRETPDLPAELKQLRDDFGHLANSVSELVKQQATAATSKLREHATTAGNALASNLNDIGNSASKLTEGAQANVMSTSRDLEASIERNPLTAVMVAAGIGMVLGMISARA